MQVDVGILTRQRPQMLRRAINAVLATSVTARIHVLFDGDEPGLGYFQTCLVNPRTRGTIVPRGFYVKGVNTLFKFMQQDNDLDYFCIINDDSEFLLHNWDQLLISEHNKEFPDGYGIISLDGEGKCGQIFSRAKLFNDHLDGCINNPAYNHYFADSELYQFVHPRGWLAAVMAQTRDGSKYAILQHNAVDDHLRIEASKWYEQDKATYEARHEDDALRE